MSKRKCGFYAYDKRHPEKKRERTRRYNQRNRRRNDLRKNYGITLEQYEEMFELQDGKCAICSNTDPGIGQSNMGVDHNHETGAVRGLLCLGCNNGLGYFKESTYSMLKAVGYLEGYAA